MGNQRSGPACQRPSSICSPARANVCKFAALKCNAYGFGLLSTRIPFDLYTSMFHGNNERIDQESLGLMTPLWEGLVRELVG